MKNDLLFLLARFRELLVCSAAAALCVGAAYIDVAALGNVVPESSVTEWSQAVILLCICVLYWRAAVRNAELRPSFVLIGGFFLCMFLREMDSWLNVMYRDLWLYLALLVALACLLFAALSPVRTVRGLALFSGHGAVNLIACGLVLTLVFSRLFGMGMLWKSILQDAYLSTAKNMVEESLELLGYLFCLLGSLRILCCGKTRGVEA